MIIARRALWLTLFVLLLVGGWKLAHANADAVRFDYLLGQVEGLRVWELVGASVAVGALIGVAGCLVEMVRLRMLSRQYRRQLVRLEAEVHGLRALPLGSPAEREGGAPGASGGGALAGRPGRGS
ncbi:MAG: LapA family protein [Deltaproteobacteria bacterium]|nr:LapA family protein [Deltaproteobacteria bacterium]